MKILLLFNDISPFKVKSINKKFYIFGSDTDYVECILLN